MERLGSRPPPCSALVRQPARREKVPTGLAIPARNVVASMRVSPLAAGRYLATAVRSAGGVDEPAAAAPPPVIIGLAGMTVHAFPDTTGPGEHVDCRLEAPVSARTPLAAQQFVCPCVASVCSPGIPAVLGISRHEISARRPVTASKLPYMF